MIPTTGYAPRFVLAGPGDLGPELRYLGGSLSPCLGDGRIGIVGSPGPRPSGDGPRDRALGIWRPDEHGRLTGEPAMIRHQPHGDPEEGVWAAVQVVGDPEGSLLLGEIAGQGGSVDVRIARYVPDGDGWRRVGVVTEVDGAEISPLAAYRHAGHEFVFEIHQDHRGWRPWQIGVNGRPVEPRVHARGGSGPFPLPDGRMALLVTLDVSDRMPPSAWYTFDPATPQMWRREDWPVPPFGIQIRLDGIDGRAYVRDARPDQHARILVMEPVADPGPLELATPYNLHVDPRAWPANGSIADVRFRDGNLHVEWDGVEDWPSYRSPDQDRAYYGHLVVIVRHEGRWIAIGFEHLPSELGGVTGVDGIFEGHGHVPSHPLGPGHRIQPGEEYYLLAAAHCRVGGGPDDPWAAGTVPQRTRIVRGVWGRDGIEDAEPAHWWQPIDDEDDDMAYSADEGWSETVKIPVPERAGDEADRIDFELEHEIEVDMVEIDPGLIRGTVRVNAAKFTIALHRPGAPIAAQHRRAVIAKGMTLVVSRPPLSTEGGEVKVTVSGRKVG